MSASIMLHGPVTASARLVQAGEFTKEPFISLDVVVPGTSLSFVAIGNDELDALADAISAARVLLPAPATA